MNFIFLLFDLIRIKHWVKNLIIFVPIIFSTQINIFFNFYDIINIFFCLSLASSTVYIFNDLIDANLDQSHLLKKNRPIQSNRISKKYAVYFMLILFLLTNFYLLFFNDFYVTTFIYLYFLINIFYTYYLKKLELIDVFTIPIFYFIRVFMTAKYFDIYISNWLITIIFLGVLLIGFSKRYCDLAWTNKNTVHKNFFYNEKYIEKIILILSSSLILAYIIFCNSDKAINKYGELFFFSSIFIFFGVFRYLKLVFKKTISDPVDIFLKDKILFFNTIFYVLFCILMIIGR